MNLRNILVSILDHPLNQHQKWRALWRFFSWQILSRAFGKKLTYQYLSKSRLIAKRGLRGSTANYYLGLHEFEDMAFLLHALKKTDLFVDVGANIGSYSILAANEIGAVVHAFEPDERAFNHLSKHVELNQCEEQIHLHQLALSDHEGRVGFSQTDDLNNHLLTEVFSAGIEIECRTFDQVVQIDRPTICKIDVEGFETLVIKGMSMALSNPMTVGLIVEYQKLGQQYGFDEADLHDHILSFGFAAYRYDPFKRLLTLRNSYGGINTIYLRDVEQFNERIKSAPTILIHGVQL